MQIAIRLASSKITPADVAFMCAAVNDQAYECAVAWGIPACPVVFYSDTNGLPPDTTHVIGIVDSISAPGALGFHDDYAGVIYGEVLAQGGDGTSVTLSHEVLEMLVDPECNRWRLMPDLRSVALEVCDPCEAVTYGQPATVLGETRVVKVSDYVLPSWFDPHGVAPFDREKTILAPFGMVGEGYEIIQDASGNVTNVFASHVPQTFARKLSNPSSRTLRRLRAA